MKKYLVVSKDNSSIILAEYNDVSDACNATHFGGPFSNSTVIENGYD